MFSIRMAMRQVKRIRKLVRNVEPIVYPAASMLFAYSTFLNKSEKDKELKPHEPFNLKHMPSFEHKINSITTDAVIRDVLKTFTISFELMINLIVEYRTFLKKFLFIHKEILDGDINNTSEKKLDLLLELRNETQSKKEQIEAMQNYISQIHLLMSIAMKLNAECKIKDKDITIKQQIEEMWNEHTGMYSNNVLKRLVLNYIFKALALINNAMGLSTLCTIDVDFAVEQLTQEVWDKLREDENNLELEQAYWHVQQQCIEKTKDTSTGSKFFNIPFWVGKYALIFPNNGFK